MIQYKVREYGRNIKEKQTGKKNAEMQIINYISGDTTNNPYNFLTK